MAKQEVRSSEDEPPDDNNFYIPSLPAGDSIKIVHLEKTSEPLVSWYSNIYLSHFSLNNLPHTIEWKS